MRLSWLRPVPIPGLPSPPPLAVTGSAPRSGCRQQGLEIPYWALNFIVLLLAGFRKPVRGRFADPRAAGARLSTARYQFNLT